jgi:NAD(P)-dependent dehydrogenase (short-subunit alcohol dehydrogenase family)
MKMTHCGIGPILADPSPVCFPHPGSSVGAMGSVLIVGASRGIGLGLVDVHLEDGWTVHATTRDGTPPRPHPDLTTHVLDVRDEGRLEELIGALDSPVDRVIHNAGVLRAPRADLMEVNADAPIRTIDALLAASRVKESGSVAIMTSQMGARRGRTGSLGDYGDSKALLNDRFRERCDRWLEVGVIAVVIHPGWVRTDMGGSGASLSVADSATGIKEVLDDLSAADHGKFLTWDGRTHPW